ncbi:helix-turn-helix domain-containing protein [Saccharopolyspora gloriosae]|uniref:Transcriptional regulator with XRE-family HTH domain n=1 Tax=Saccharopolyspora gloriosae TaxID=455344 RepID=A0A840NKI0_9PSEU|nr:helix-turn-helix domain-containing protein [Saccharopolyspora gloriosae]MBB5070818.1 transcriptional regulator with XRE-family HTH domain [Saccharopolyspora gloriosae]
MTDAAHRSELGDFLRARRGQLSPAAVGLPGSGGRRRVRGLRREEVAALTSISTDHYTRLEQGRRQASEPVLDALARVLRLGDDERAYLFGLSGKDAAPPGHRVVQEARPQLRRLLDDLTGTPAVVLGRRTDVLAWNPMAAALFLDFARIPPQQRNFVRLVFTDPAFRALYPDWEHTAQACAAQLRMEAALDPDDPALAELVGELSALDPDFRRWWGAHEVAVRSEGAKRLCHPIAGDLTLDWSTLTCATDPGQQLIALTAEPGTPGDDGLRLLAARVRDEAEH